MEAVPSLRITRLGERPLRPERDLVLYWMVANRRRHHNFALQHASNMARELGKPLVVLEPLRCGYRWASDRIHAFVLAGMRDHEREFADGKALYWPYVEPEPGAGSGLLAALAKRACVVVTDEWPAFFVPRMQAAAAEAIDVRLEAVDANGLLPLRVNQQAPIRAYLFRRLLQKSLPVHLLERPAVDPLAGGKLARIESLPVEITKRWPRATRDLLDGHAKALQALPIDHTVIPVPALPGGPVAGRAALSRFLTTGLARYHEERSDPDADAQSGLSPYLHFGHLGTHQILHELAACEGWDPSRLASEVTGKSSGWWGMSASAESFLDELVTWREMGFHECHFHPDSYDSLASLPDWVRRTLDEHRKDPREHLYSLAEFEQARTHDALWNAAQTQLVREGRIHNYLRMLWGKKILEWSKTPQAALATLIELNNKYALDGRDPNSYTGILWCLGKFDRPWAPARPVYGMVRYMSSENTKRKWNVKRYLEAWAPRVQRGLFA